MQCDMCGRDSILVDAIVEGSMIKVCRNCASYGHVVRVPTEDVLRVTSKTTPTLSVNEEIIVEDYSGRVKHARESKKMTQEDLAKNIAEKESVIHKIESGQYEPTLDLAKKLEQFLRIKLVTAYKENSTIKKDLDLKNSSVTIGDILKLKDEE